VIEDSWDLACSNNIDHQVIIGNMKSLLADAYVNDIGKSVEIWLLTPEGQTVMAQGSPEYQVYLAVPDGSGIPLSSLAEIVGPAVSKIGLGPCMKNKWIKKDKDMLVRLAADAVDETAEMFRPTTLTI
jgi:phenylalanyl-tRNA synthetase alpha chain